MYALTDKTLNLDAQTLAQRLLGTVIRHKLGRTWLAAQIIETEAYFLTDKASHASLGRTPSREPLFMPAGTIYMYYARGGDSLNFSAQGAGNAVLIKSAIPAIDHMTAAGLRRMNANNPTPRGDARQLDRLCSGQTLLCRALGLKVPIWNGRQLTSGKLELLDVGNAPQKIVQTKRLGIPAGRDPHLPYRFVDQHHTRSATRNPIGRSHTEGIDYRLINSCIS